LQMNNCRSKPCSEVGFSTTAVFPAAGSPKLPKTPFFVHYDLDQHWSETCAGI
jgi:hypothetical protein